MSKVFVLVKDSIYPNGELDIKVRTFGTRQAAEDAMREQYDAELFDWKSTYDNDYFEVEAEEMSRSIWESGRYMENHIAWEIKKCEVE
jgi:murein L,D-transpeptidase YafK